VAERCDKCRFWDRALTSSVLGIEVVAGVEGGPVGKCRRWPPQEPTGAPIVSVGLHPWVSCADWCGEWRGLDDDTGQ